MADGTCRVPECDRPLRANGLCKMHDARLKNTGTLDLTGQCQICGLELPYPGRGPRRTLCGADACRRAYDVRKSSDYARRNPDKVRAAKRRAEAKKPEHHANVRRKAHLRREYGITIEAYEWMLAAQGGGCAICGATRGNSRRKRLAVDHDHTTGRVRGLLCYQCNSLVGNAKDDPEVLSAAIVYLVANGRKRPPRQLA